ncbi:hybrid sensor histidine kinase/response regulator [Draconibacterium sp. IB214405]|uniref:hybrid sensor histidine kinase/response regulator n=1 Tax=Draconibacterium sp. IB214405 TaxID=3097352 RepID=UPI002A17ED07|nr:hybrid sensor histidine kinase/response regulator [Draconibacterium sp. IB214405]MDX8340822.1 hybrid sensor histidine kinase/response regulator [Draconibacterium sp. IB214405]
MPNSDNQKPIILIVDDVPKNIQVLGTLLAKFDCELAIAMNGQQALDTVEKVKPDLILLDVMMPILDGHETCRILKSNEKTKDIPVIFLSAKTETEDIVKGFELGAVDYVTKPFIGSELLARVKTHLTLKTTQNLLGQEVTSKNKFFSIISHDLRGAFGIIMNFVQIIQENEQFLSKEEIDELLNDIGNTSKNTLDLLENLLRWARSQTGSIKFEPENHNLLEILCDVVRKQEHIAQAKSIALEYEIDAPLHVYGDKNMIFVILRNIIANAIKFTHAEGKILISGEDLGDSVKIMVTDNGTGIKPEVIEKLFSIHTKVSTHGTEQEQGNGLGLVLCHEFVKRNKGKIGIDSVYGEGTTVWFTLPKPQQ